VLLPEKPSLLKKGGESLRFKLVIIPALGAALRVGRSDAGFFEAI
jgi:hypothetical protein